ncbi:MAG TPA: hypothetical protein DCP71_01375, partial [Verrucomicrobiales bacterium]|nr:hypothetical protein [Verrucomicrobiales bacterium]
MSPEKLTLFVVALPGVFFLLMGLVWLLGGHLPERVIARLTKAAYALLTVAVGFIGWQMWQSGTTSIQISLGDWFQVDHYGFPLSFLVDRLSLPMMAITIVLVGIVGSFSVRYLHRDPGFNRFFLLLHLFTFGALLVFTAGSLDLLMAGWEIVGITAVLLVGFFQYRREPVRNALRVFGIYRIADVNLLMAIFLAHHWFGTAAWTGMFSGEWPGHVNNLDGAVATVIA